MAAAAQAIVLTNGRVRDFGADFDPRFSAGAEVRACEDALRLPDYRTARREHLVGERTGALEQRAVLAEVGEAQIADSGLPRTEQLATAAELEVDLRELEAVRGRDQRL